MPDPSMQISANDVAQFATIFRGLDTAYGGTEGNSLKERPSEGLYRKHLQGERSIGIYPLMRDGMIWFAAIDFDRKIDKETKRERSPDEIDAIAMADARAVLLQLDSIGVNIGVYLERSKSKGAHVWIFFDRPAPAASVIRILKWAFDSAVGPRPSDPIVEIFPKQESLDRVTFGNYINLPYFGALPRYPENVPPHTIRRVVLEPSSLAPMTLEEFLTLHRGGGVFPAREIPEILAKLPAPEPSQRAAPVQADMAGKQANGTARNTGRLYPCTLAMLQHGLPEGTGRNTFGFLLSKRLHVGGLGDDGGYVQFQAWNGFNSPPLPGRELETVWEQGAKYSSMGCDDPEVVPFCKTSCPIHPQNRTAEYVRVRKELSEPPRYVLTVNGLDVRIPSADRLFSHQKIRLATLEQHNVILPAMKAEKWEDRLKELMQLVEEHEIPETATGTGLLWIAIRNFFSNRVQYDEEPEMFVPGEYVVEREQWCYFRGERLYSHLETVAKVKARPEEVWALVRGHGGVSTTKRFGGQVLRCWALPLSAVETIE